MATITPLFNAQDNFYISIEDGATPYLKYLANTFPNEMRKALKSLGWWMQQKMKKETLAGAPGGVTLSPLSGIQRVRLLDAIKRRKKTKAGKFSGTARPMKAAYLAATEDMKPYGKKLPNAIRYVYSDAEMAVTFGFVTPSAKSFGRMMAGGWRGKANVWGSKGNQVVTEPMRKLFAAAGIFLKRGSVLRSPARPMVDPILARYRSDIPVYIEDKVSAWLRKSLARGTANVIPNVWRSVA